MEYFSARRDNTDASGSALAYRAIMDGSLHANEKEDLFYELMPKEAVRALAAEGKTFADVVYKNFVERNIFWWNDKTKEWYEWDNKDRYVNIREQMQEFHNEIIELEPEEDWMHNISHCEYYYDIKMMTPDEWEWMMDIVYDCKALLREYSDLLDEMMERLHKVKTAVVHEDW